MTRYRYGGGIADWTMAVGDDVVIGELTGKQALIVGGQTITFWTLEQGGDQYTDLVNSDGVPTDVIVSSDGTGARAAGQIPPFFGPDGVTTMWAQAGDGPRALMVTTDAADVVVDPGTILPPLSVSGPVSAGVGVHRLYNDTTATLRVAGVRASVGTAPTGSALIIDVKRNGTSIYSAPDNRPSIPVGANTSGKNTQAEVTALTPGDYLTVDVVQAGTGTANLVVQILVTRG